MKFVSSESPQYTKLNQSHITYNNGLHNEYMKSKADFSPW